MPSYTALYKGPRGEKLIVKTLSLPAPVRKFKVAGGVRKFKRVKYKHHLQEVIIVAKSTKAAKNKKSAEVTDDEIDELEGLEDLDEELEDEEVEEDEDEDEDEEEDEDEDEEEDDEDEDDEEEEPAAKKKGKGKPKAKKSNAAKNGFVGTAELADDLDIDSRTLRMVLRKLREQDDAFAPDSESGRYQWKSLNDPQVKKIRKAIAKGVHKDIKKESLDRLKEKKAAEKAAKDKTDKKSAKSGTKVTSGKKTKTKKSK